MYLEYQQQLIIFKIFVIFRKYGTPSKNCKQEHLDTITTELGSVAFQSVGIYSEEGLS